MIRVRCEKCGRSYAQGDGHECRGAKTDAPQPFDERSWRRAYMREYMRRWRARERSQPEEK